MRDVSPQVVLCNGANLPQQWTQYEPLILEYREIVDSIQNVKLALPDFVRTVIHLPDRILDLLEIASYIFCADRLVSRGATTNVEYHSWSRSFHFVIKVRDFKFWNTPDIKEKLKAALVFMSGDRTYHFSFQSGHSTPQADMFDKRTFQIEPKQNTKAGISQKLCESNGYQGSFGMIS